MKNNVKMMSLIIAIFAINVAFGQYEGPSYVGEVKTVAFVKSNAANLDKTDALVKLKGYIIEKTNKDTYWFKDETGKILIEIKEKDLPTFAFNEKTLVIIVAEVDYDILEDVELEVEMIQLAK